MHLLIGDKSVFAVEAESGGKEWRYSNCRLWFGGVPVGYYEDEIMMSSFLYNINVSPREFTAMRDDKCSSMEPRLALDYLSRKSSNAVHIFNPAESFDDFIVFRWTRESDLCFVWTMSGSPNFSYPDFSLEVRYSSVPYLYYQGVVTKAYESFRDGPNKGGN